MSARSGLDRQFAELRDALQQYGHSRFPLLRGEVEDLVAESLANLWEYLKKRPGPGSHRSAKVDAAALRKVAFTIFKRRAADAFRKSAKQWAMSLESLPEEKSADPKVGDAERRTLMQKILRVCIAELAEAPASDRVLLAAVAGFGPGPDAAMDAHDRQRLHRLRQRLAAAIRRELGEDARRLLREDI